MKTARYLEIFAREAEEHLQLLRQGIMALEKAGPAPEWLQQLLRSAHTLKGSSRMLDLQRLGQVAHSLEDLFQELESGVRAVTPELVDLLLLATDALEALVAEAHSGGEVTVNVEAVLHGLQTGQLPEHPPAPAPVAADKEAADTVRTSVPRMDALVDRSGELLILQRLFMTRGEELKGIKNRLDAFLGTLRRAENYRRFKDVCDDFARLTLDLERDNLSLHQLTSELHGEAMALRMLPLHTISDELQRLVRDLARSQDKELTLEMTGAEVEMDRMMLEAVKPMLLHLLRNAVDHGIEPPAERQQGGKARAGTIRLAATCEQGFIQIRLHDDGRGIDPELVRRTAVARKLLSAEAAAALSARETLDLILRPGFSTREIITDISGRGVGLDVVKSQIDRVKGHLLIRSTLQVGTEIVLQFPLTLAVMAGLVIDCQEETYALPLHHVVEILRLTEVDILTEGGRDVIRVHGTTLPLFSLAEMLQTPAAAPSAPPQRLTALVLRYREQEIACLVTRTRGVQDLVVKGMGAQMKSVTFCSGATILSDGTPAPILSIPDLFGAGTAGRTRLRQSFEAEAAQPQQRILVVDDSITTRTMEKNILETHGYQVTVAISGEEALEQATQGRFDLVVTDIEMPGIDGFALTEKLRGLENFREVPVIIVTSRASDADKRKGIAVGAQAYIVKGSFDQGTLLQTVQTLIG